MDSVKQTNMTNEKRFKCDLCTKSYTQLKALKIHNSNIHLEKKMFKCLECDKTFSDSTPLSNHIKTIHVEPGTFNCSQCAKVFSHEPKLKAHIYREHRTIMKIIKCLYCEKNVDKWQMSKH